ncbi:MAG: type I restriction endonuclease subunit R [Bacilli bacterium]|nr:type I restriction endonuclease subunit R [Bacilli bacterium]
MSSVNVISENMSSTVVSEYKGLKNRSKQYQSEQALEKEFIKTLEEQSYEYLKINSERELIKNLRLQLEKLNNYRFADNEWNYFFDKIIANSNNGILEKTKMIQEDYIQTITLDDGSLKNIYLIDKDNIHNNYLQVINQYENSGSKDNRYDVTVLVNGIPLVHVELKKRGVDIKEAFNQIERYQRDSFWANSGLYEFIQIFVISNGTYTKYYSNTTRDVHIRTNNEKRFNTFEFTSYWADQHNNAIIDLIDFAETFFSKNTILNIICKYCVFTSDNNLLVMRPYQIVATEKIINKIKIANNYKYSGTIKAGGYVWHTTGSGKTLTSFKTSVLASKLGFVDKVLFVVDRKDLDYQTMKEYDKFQKGAANSNTSTKILERQLGDDTSKIIITTIQKLDNFIKKKPGHEVFNKNVVFIFDECHRSQFGEMHKNIVKKFNKYFMFGFTGTPIFGANCKTNKGVMQTTEQVFGEKLHTYTIVNAINDNNVLPFRYEFIETMDVKADIKDEKVMGINTEKAYSDSIRINLITNYIIEHFSNKTKTSESYVFNALDNIVSVAKNRNILEERSKKNINGFNSLFAVSSIPLAKKYYEAFKLNTNHNLKVALIYSYGMNDEVIDGIEDENCESTDSLSKSDRDFLEVAINDYNHMFGTNYDTSSEKFQNYYKDVSLRMKNKEIDILIVVNMFLTGFDATTLNTLWVDKNLKYHGLIQAFSRTNRILNSVKTYGNIVCFRNLEKELEEALALFGDSEASSIVLLKSYEDYYYGYVDKGKVFVGYQELVRELKAKYPVGKLIIGENNQKEFIKLYGAVLKVVNILNSFDKFKKEKLLSDRDTQDYHSMYIDLYNHFRKNNKADKVDIADDIVFEMELIKQIEVNVDYILSLIQKYHESNIENKEILVTIDKAIMSSPDLRNKKELIEEFIKSINETADVYGDFTVFMNGKKKEELDKIIKEENLDPNLTYNFIQRAFENGSVETNGTGVSEILPPTSMFTKTNDRLKQKNNVLYKLMNFFDKFFSISNSKL